MAGRNAPGSGGFDGVAAWLMALADDDLFPKLWDSCQEPERMQSNFSSAPVMASWLSGHRARPTYGEPNSTSTPAVNDPIKSEGKVDAKKNFEDLIETVISTIQEPEITEAGIAAVMAKLQAYSTGINQLVDALPPGTANGRDGGSGAGAAV
eukprot:g11773.t1